MLKKFTLLAAAIAMISVGAQSASAIGVYADVPISMTLDDCDKKKKNQCEYNSSASGLKAGVVMGNNVGLGINTFSIDMAGAWKGFTADYTMFDVSYLLPIPFINITAGIGGGPVNLGDGQNDVGGNVMAVWGSVGFPILIADIHVGYHKIKGGVAEDAFSQDLSGTLFTVGTLINF